MMITSDDEEYSNVQYYGIFQIDLAIWPYIWPCMEGLVDYQPADEMGHIFGHMNSGIRYICHYRNQLMCRYYKVLPPYV